jgi:hypothetical protein
MVAGHSIFKNFLRIEDDLAIAITMIVFEPVDNGVFR